MIVIVVDQVYWTVPMTLPTWLNWVHDFDHPFDPLKWEGERNAGEKAYTSNVSWTYCQPKLCVIFIYICIHLCIHLPSFHVTGCNNQCQRKPQRDEWSGSKAICPAILAHASGLQLPPNLYMFKCSPFPNMVWWSKISTFHF